MRVRIRLHTVEVVEKGDGIGAAEPFLWPLYYKVDARAITHLNQGPSALGDEPVWLVAPDGAHGNLGGGVRTGDTITIPSALGEVIFELNAASLLSADQVQAGFVVALLEEDLLPTDAGIAHDYKQFSSEVTRALRARIIASLSDTQRELFGLEAPDPSASSDKDLEQRVIASIKTMLHRWASASDDLIGVRHEVWTQNQLEARPSRVVSARWTPATGSEDGSFTLEGDVQAEVPMDGQPSAILWTVDRAPHLHFRSSGRHLHQVWYDGSGWSHLDLSAAVRGVSNGTWPPEALGSPLAVPGGADHGQHVLYRGADDHLHEIAWRGAWQHLDLCAASGGAPPVDGRPTAWAWHGDMSQHVAYRGRDGHIVELWHKGKWNHHDLTLAAPGAPNAIGDPEAIEANGVPTVVFRGADRHLHALCFEGAAGWRHYDLTEAAGALDAASDPALVADGESAVLVYLSTDGQLVALRGGLGAWTAENLSETADAPACRGRPALGHHDDGLMLAYRGEDAHIHTLLRRPDGWKARDLHEDTHARITAVSDPAIVSGGKDGALHVAFRGHDAHLHLFSLSERWRHVDLSLAARFGF